MDISSNYINSMNSAIRSLINDAVKISLKNPSTAGFMLKTLSYQKNAENLRMQWEHKGVHVPPFMIASITGKCNLKCKGCYAHAQNRKCQSELTVNRWNEIFEEARELGISFILLAGGEPFVRRDILSTAGKFPEIIFPVFTNSLLIDDCAAAMIEKHKNIIPVISMEGYEEETDTRRGSGVFKKTKDAIDRLKDRNIFFGISLTITAENFQTIIHENFVKNLSDRGCRIFFYVEYVPVEEGTERLVLTVEQRRKLDDILNQFRSKYSGLFISFPGDEKEFGGCLSSGRGFVHISPEGNLEPCPFAPYSDTNLRNITLKDALKSEFLSKIRNSEEHLSETEGGCALFNKQDWVRSLLKKNV